MDLFPILLLSFRKKYESKFASTGIYKYDIIEIALKGRPPKFVMYKKSMKMKFSFANDYVTLTPLYYLATEVEKGNYKLSVFE